MGSGCEILIAAKLPSSARQLPILAALHARASTLFGHIIHQSGEKVNSFFKIIDKFLSKESPSIIYMSLRGVRSTTWQSPGTVHRQVLQKQTSYREIPTACGLGMTF